MKASYLYAAWAFVAILGAGVHLVGLQEALSDVAEVRDRHLPTARELYARTAVRHEILRLYLQLCFGAVAAGGALTGMGLTLPPYAVATLTLGAAGLLLQSLLDRRARHQLLGIGLRDEAELDETPTQRAEVHALSE